MAEIVGMAEGPKNLIVKLNAERYLKFVNLARKMGVSPTLLAQDLIDYFMEDCEKSEAEREFPPLGNAG